MGSSQSRKRNLLKSKVQQHNIHHTCISTLIQTQLLERMCLWLNLRLNIGVQWCVLITFVYALICFNINSPVTLDCGNGWHNGSVECVVCASILNMLCAYILYVCTYVCKQMSIKESDSVRENVARVFKMLKKYRLRWKFFLPINKTLPLLKVEILVQEKFADKISWSLFTMYIKYVCILYGWNIKVFGTKQLSCFI